VLSDRELAKLVSVASDTTRDPTAANDAFGRIVSAFQDYAVGAAYAYLRDFAAAEDVAQEAFLAAWRALPQLRDPVRFPAWFKQILARCCNRALRGQRAREPGRAEISAPDVEALLNARERRRLIHEALLALPAPQRLAISLFYFAGEDHAAIARFLGVPRTTIVKRVHAARQRLRPMLEPLRFAIAKQRPSATARFGALVRAGIYDEYVGTYRYVSRPELRVTVKRVGNRLVSFSNGQKNRVLLGDRLSHLRAAEFDGVGHFCRDRRGRITHFVYYEFGKRMGIAKKQMPAK
jgi:RNA polymerase sigma-70 factor (ECF subfamily)